MIIALQNQDFLKNLAVNFLRGCVVDESAQGKKNPFEHTSLK